MTIQACLNYLVSRPLGLIVRRRGPGRYRCSLPDSAPLPRLGPRKGAAPSVCNLDANLISTLTTTRSRLSL